MDYEIACTGGAPASKRRAARALLEKLGADIESSSLVRAVEDNDMDTVEHLLASGVDWSVPDTAGNTVLHTAARRGHADLCALLVSHGADVDCQNNARFSPLFFAAGVDLQTVCVLLHLGAQVQLRNNLGEIPLHAAASSGLVDVIVTLISCGSDVNTRSMQGLTPLYCAVGSGSREAVKTLLRLGAEVNSVITPEFSITSTGADRCEEEEPCALKETAASDGDKEHQHHVRLRFSGQEQHYHCDKLTPAMQQLHRPEGSGRPTVSRHRHEDNEIGHGRQCGCSGPCRGKEPPSVPNLCSPHLSRYHCQHHYSPTVCSTTHHPRHCQTHLQHQPQLEGREAPSSLAQSVFNVLENEHSQAEENVSEIIAQPMSEMLPHSRDKVAHPENPLHSNPGHMAARCRPPLLQFSTCSMQINARHPLIPHSFRKISCNAAADDHHTTSERGKLSAHVRQSRTTHVEDCHSGGMKIPASFRQSQRTEEDEEVIHQSDREVRGIETQSAGHCQSPLPFAGLTVLHRACQLGMETVAEALLEAGASLDARTEKGETPLHMAALYSSTASHGEVTGLIRLLLRAGANVGAVTITGSTPLHLAAMVGDALCTSLLLSDRTHLHTQDNRGNTPLHKACERVVSPEANRVRTVRLLLMNGASAQMVNKEGLTPLHILLMHKTDNMDHDILRVLLMHHADPNLATPSGESPLLVALRHHMYGFAMVLVEKGADPNVMEDDGKTPLHHVCKEGQLQLFKLLWSKGGKPARPDHEGFTPLRYALESGEEVMVRACISSGASSMQPSPGAIAASSVTDLFSSPATWISPFLYAFATTRCSLLSTLFYSGCFSSDELHSLRQLCRTSSLQTLSIGQREVVSFVLTVGLAPASLQNLSRWTISRLIGCGPDRKWRASQLGLPSLLRDFVLFAKGA